MKADTLSVIDALGRETSTTGVLKILDTVMLDHGFDRLIVSGLGHGHVPLVEITSLPEGWLEHYNRQGYWRDDPVVKRALVATRPFDWSDAPFDEHSQQVADTIAAEGREFGLATGYSVPLPRSSGRPATMSFVGGEKSDRQRRPELHMLALYAYEQIRQVNFSEKAIVRQVLTDREVEVLKWVAAGKSSGEIATIMGMSERTVNQHCENAQRRLQTSNRTHTVVEAIRRGYVNL